MANIENPNIQILIYRSFGQLVYGSDDMEVRIYKDLSEDPNTAEITIHNLNEDHRNEIKDAGKESSPVEVYLSQWGSPNVLVRCFTGEIDTAKNIDNYPDAGMRTVISATSQKINHRSKYISEKTFVKGTPYAVIITFLAQAVGLPTMFGILPPGVTLYSYSVSGSAFKALKNFLYDFGYYAYIRDGNLYIVDHFTPPNPAPVLLDSNLLLNAPETTTRSDANDVEIQTIRMNKIGDVIKKVHNVNLQGPATYMPESVQDTIVEGRAYHFPCFPDREPDDIILVGTELTRIQSIEHECDNLTESSIWESHIEADLFTGF